jgi:hypothetical protein
MPGRSSAFLRALSPIGYSDGPIGDERGEQVGLRSIVGGTSMATFSHLCVRHLEGESR